MHRIVLISAASLAFASPAFAFTDPPANGAEATAPAENVAQVKPAKDPNRMICRREKEIGSRLNAKKTCMTAREWEEQRQTQAVEVDKIQKARPLNGGG